MALGMVVFDSNVLIYFIENDIVFGQPAAIALAKAAEHDSAGFSVLALTELTAQKQTAAQLKKLSDMSPFVSFIDFNKSMALSAGKLRATFAGLKTPDAIHLSTALANGAKQFVTNDEQLTKISVPKLTITLLKGYTKV